MTETTTKPKFSPGVLLATPGAIEALEKSGETVFPYLQRHLNGDWGDLCSEDKMLNDQALVGGSRLLSAYHLKDGTKIWIITEAVGENGCRQSSTALLPSKY